MVTRRESASSAATDILGTRPEPPCYRLDQASAPVAIRAPAPTGQTVRVWARSLTGMQKEALVATAGGGPAWRLASDEGPYLNGFDAAPCPLAFMTVGMVAAFLDALQTAAVERDLVLPDLTVRLDNRYTMEGSALQGTMRGGALPIELEVRVRPTIDEAALDAVIEAAVRQTAVDGLVRGQHTSLFTLTKNGAALPVGRVRPLDALPPTDPQGLWASEPLAAPTDPLVTRVDAVVPTDGVAGGAGTSLQATQRRQLHVRGIGRFRADGVKEIEQQLHQPLGSTFRFLSDEAPGGGGAGRAPDAASYMAAGVAFCFMTQLGRYATIVERDLSGYRLVQDTRFLPGTAEPVRTHVYLDTAEDDAFARQCLDMAEQTCFLHALYRTPLEPRLTVQRD